MRCFWFGIFGTQALTESTTKNYGAQEKLKMAWYGVLSFVIKSEVP